MDFQQQNGACFTGTKRNIKEIIVVSQSNNITFSIQEQTPLRDRSPNGKAKLEQTTVDYRVGVGSE